MSTPEVLQALFGINSNPFTPYAVDPYSARSDVGLLALVDGFSRLRSLDDSLARAIEQKQPSFFLVTGKSGTGRSLAAKYIMNSYRQRRGLKPERFLIPNPNRLNHDPADVFRRWLGFCFDDLDALHIELNPKLVEEIKEEVANESARSVEATFRRIMRKVSEVLAASDAGLAVCLENIPDYNLMASALEIFDRSQVVCVCTVNEYIDGSQEALKSFRWFSDQAKECVLELSLLDGAEVRAFVDDVWKQATQVSVPFDLDGIENAFSDKQRPLGRVRALMAQLLDLKLIHDPQGPPWSKDKLLNTVPILEAGGSV